MTSHTPFLVAAAFATALMGHSGALPDFSGLDSDSEIRGSMTVVKGARSASLALNSGQLEAADWMSETGLIASINDA
ncbi:MAG: hypothetical protein WA989_08890 [Henriciella sp.]|uniref:hypothetical protein n=1 Tax=Henriciella sp. TaxID=1968823 RepID=UPI003C7197D1